ncbi:MAG TPA: 30S ribosomal protein S9 [Spirochaetia bacterium]|nr:30S ribosomal protein S9 [Spirochaetia bacterium]
MAKNLTVATGKRKTSVARVFLRDGAGAVMINGKSVDEYFAGLPTAQSVMAPLDVTNTTGKFDVLVTVRGGGVSSQIEACRHGIARALNAYDASNHVALRANGFLTRDPRMVERKKYGQSGARRRFQFSKR